MTPDPALQDTAPLPPVPPPPPGPAAPSDPAVADVAPAGTRRGRLRRAAAEPVVALSLLAASAQLPAVATLLLAGDIAASTGSSRGAVVARLVLATAMAAGIALPLAGLASRTRLRDAMAVGGASAWAVGLLLVGLLDSAGPAALVLVAAGAATATVRVVHEPILLATTAARARPTALAVHWAAGVLGVALAAGAVAGLSTGLTWRGTTLVLGGTALAAAALATRVRDAGDEDDRAAAGQDQPEQDRPEQDRPELDRPAQDQPEQDQPEQDQPDQDEAGDAVAAELGVLEICRRVLLVPSVRGALAPVAAAGALLLPLQTGTTALLAWRWGVGDGGAAAGLGLVFLAAATGALWGARASLANQPVDPARQGDAVLAVRRSAAVGALGLLLGPFLPAAVPALLVVGAGAGLVLAVQPVVLAPALLAVPARMRVHVAALAGIALLAGGGLGGLAYVGLLAPRFGPDVGIAALALPVLAVLPGLRRLAAGVDEDLRRHEEELREAREVLALGRRSGPRRLLECRHIDFSYGQLQILFGVDMVVDEGEVVALLGTNGAGKSTLLRVISGLGLPSRGSVTFDGLDVTHLDAERRLPLGLAQIPGGKAVFGPLTVLDNLRVYGHAMGRDRAGVEAGIEATFAAFPRLHERSGQLASTLSGGEQQMLALGKSLILRPKLLLIDELSLGLAPKIVGELLTMVRSINAAGTAVVLVEQSVNVALSLAQRAYFMEKGEVRFDGPSQELLDRPDILRSVFLEGAAQGIG
jgi:ABC-type branched-subunit amino acid transport system ATPase component